MADPRRFRPVWAEIDVDALRHNAAVLSQLVSPARLCAVVKADAYGHGALVAARAALDGGASWLAVALVEEGIELREHGIAEPVLLLSEPPPGAMEEALARDLVPTLYTSGGVEALATAAKRLGRSAKAHLKVDTGMHRVGADLRDIGRVAQEASEAGIDVEGLWTHLAVADGGSPEDREFTAEQLRRFEGARQLVSSLGVSPTVLHVANSAGAVAYPEARGSMVRCGIALYGALGPLTGGSSGDGPSGEELATTLGMLRPVLSLRARVSFTRELAAGARPSYGRLRALREDSVVATVPIGYADGVARSYFSRGGVVLVGGRRCPLAGMVTMDQIMVDCGPGAEVSAGDEVVLIGRQGSEELTALDWARTLGTISYEVLSGIGSRVPRVRVAGDE
ncbi:MAG: alanine racemase [Actinomycetota bacterium]|jgi:alanine racemase|nr:alanine racemase [Actinomycetota bacterium]